MKKRVEEITVTVGQDSKVLQVEACDCKMVSPGIFKFIVRRKEAGYWKSIDFFDAPSFTVAAQTAYHKSY